MIISHREYVVSTRGTTNELYSSTKELTIYITE